jgi:hypothetical protein
LTSTSLVIEEAMICMPASHRHRTGIAAASHRHRTIIAARLRPHAYANHSAALLFDGTVFVTGGTVDAAPAARDKPPAFGRR